MTHTPAEILRAALEGLGAVAAYNATPWPCFVDHMPPTPDECVCVYRTTGTKDGRLMAGATIRHPGFQIRVRGMDHRTTWERAALIQTALDSIKNTAIVLDGENYTITAATQTGDALDNGQEPEAARRNIITINGTLTLGA